MAGPRGLIVAIDGVIGAGKSTVARGVAAALGYRHLDTGAMSVVSGNTQGSGPAFHSPSGIAAVQAGNGFPPSLVVADSSFGPEGLPAIVAISIASRSNNCHFVISKFSSGSVR